MRAEASQRFPFARWRHDLEGHHGDPKRLGGAGLQFNNSLPVPAFFASPGQVNVQIPWELRGQTQASLSVAIGGITYQAVSVSLAPFAPGIFTINQQGTGQGGILIADTGELAAPAGSVPGQASRPARRGEFLTIFCTGLGDVTNRPASGAAAWATRFRTPPPCQRSPWEA